MEIIVKLFLITASFFVIWFGFGFVIKSIDSIAKKSQVSSFIISFFVLGLFTSVPEIGIIFASIHAGDTSVSIGNLFGGILVLLFVIIPVYAIITEGVVLNDDSEKKIFNEAVLLILLPFVVIHDKRIDSFDAIFLLLGYGFLLYKTYSNRNKEVEQELQNIIQGKSSLIDYIKHSVGILFGMSLVLVTSDFLIGQTLDLSEKLNIYPFMTSLFLLAFGTNLPEISIMLRYMAAKEKEIALGNYLGSAVAYVFLIAIAVFFGGAVNLQQNTAPLIVYIVFAMGLFFLFFRLNNKLSRFEGFVLLGTYILFLGYQFLFAA